MNTENVSVSLNSYYFNLLFTLLFSVMAYFVYDGLKGALAIFLLCLLYDVIIFLSLIPFGGCVVQAVLMILISTPFFALVGISPTWLTTVIFWAYLIYGIIVTIVSSIALLILLDY